METVDFDDLESRLGPGRMRASLRNALRLERLGANYYELDPGEQLAFGVHAHSDQEEVFFVTAGEVTFETYETREAAIAGGDGERGEGSEGSEGGESVVITAGGAIRFEAGEYQCGRNESDAPATVIGVGAPEDPGELDLLRDCEPCGARTDHRIELSDDKTAILAVCDQCDGETARYTT